MVLQALRAIHVTDSSVSVRVDDGRLISVGWRNLGVLTRCPLNAARHMVLKIVTNTWRVHDDIDLLRVQKVLFTNTRELKYLRSVDSTTAHNNLAASFNMVGLTIGLRLIRNASSLCQLLSLFHFNLSYEMASKHLEILAVHIRVVVARPRKAARPVRWIQSLKGHIGTNVVAAVRIFHVRGACLRSSLDKSTDTVINLTRPRNLNGTFRTVRAGFRANMLDFFDLIRSISKVFRLFHCPIHIIPSPKVFVANDFTPCILLRSAVTDIV